MNFISIIAISILYFLIFILISIVAFVLKIYVGKSLRDPNYPPVLGTVFHQALHFKTLYDHQAVISKRHPTHRLLAPSSSAIYTTDPRNIEHILKTNFSNYGKEGFIQESLADLFGQGIFAVDGEKWKQQRKLASFEFSTRVLRDFSCNVFRRNAIKLARIIADFSERKQVVNIHDMLMRYAIDSIFKVGFGVDLNCQDESSKEGVDFMKAFDEANEMVYWRFVDPIWKLKRILNLGSEAALRKNIKIMDKFVHQTINQKRSLFDKQQYTLEKDDILTRFLEASKIHSEQMNDKYIRDIILNFMIAGKDTTANALSWFIYALCMNPIVQETIVQEIKEVVANKSISDQNSIGLAIDLVANCITDEALEKLNYLHAALSETLRLYPVVPVDGRSARADDVLPDGYRVTRGDDVYYMAYAMGRMQHIWGDDAEEFRPERWLENGVFRSESPFKFVAFHAGPRICLGKDFAYRQMKIVAAILLCLFRFVLADEKKVTYKTMLTLHMDGGLHVYAIPRITSVTTNVHMHRSPLTT